MRKKPPILVLLLFSLGIALLLYNGSRSPEATQPAVPLQRRRVKRSTPGTAAGAHLQHAADRTQAAQAADDGLPPPSATLTLTIGTASMREYVYNWLYHAGKIPQLRPFYAVALDRELLTLCVTWGEPVLDAAALLTDDAAGFNATAQLRGRGYLRNERASFKVFGYLKARLLLALLRRGHDVLLSDADSVFLGDPWAWIRPSSASAAAGQLPAADILLSNDLPGLQRDGQPDSVFNSGLIFLRSGRRALRFVSEWAERTRRTAEIGNDQTELNRLLRGRYQDGDFGCNHDGCLQRDPSLFVPTAAAFTGPGCPTPTTKSQRHLAGSLGTFFEQPSGSSHRHQRGERAGLGCRVSRVRRQE